MKTWQIIIFSAHFILIIVIFKVSLILGWSRPAGFMLGLLVVVYGMFITIGFTLWITILRRQFETIESQGESVLIVAPHQDDGVAMAGGFAIQTMEKGGKVDVLFITDGPGADKTTRRQEALEAWSHAGLPEASIHFLPFDTGFAFVNRPEIDDGIRQIRSWIQKLMPQVLFIPLYEGGHYQHDVVNFIVRQALLEMQMENIRVYEAPLYNYYYSWRTTPEKVLSGMARLIPFLKYPYPPEPIREKGFIQLRMTQDQLQMKKEMLVRFRTQNPERLVERFGFEDRYQPFHDYDYALPPFEYTASLARRFDRWKRIPVMGKSYLECLNGQGRFILILNTP